MSQKAGPMKSSVVPSPPPPHIPTSGSTIVRVMVTPKKSLVDAYVLGLALGFLGAHHFYLRRPWFGIAYFFTFGLLGVGYLVDLIRMPWLVSEANKKLENPTQEEERNLCDAYLLWFPFGLLGFHLFYLRKPGQGALYFCTFGLLGIGWLVDAFRIPSLAREANNPQEPQSPKSLCAAYILGASPFGIIGAHHYYLNRPLWGVLYTFTGGLGCVGWVYDWFRMPFLLKRSNNIIAKEEEAWRKHVDDIYILWFPFGFLGLHHFYLNRPGWGLLYLFTFGLLGIGWLIDFCRLPCLVADYNRNYREQGLIVGKTHPSAGGATGVTPGGQTVITVSNMTPGTIMTSPSSNGTLPPPYSYQNMDSYPPQGYPQEQNLYPNMNGYYQNQGFEAGLPPPPPMGAAAPPMPPSYEESINTQEKSDPPPEVHRVNTTNTKSK